MERITKQQIERVYKMAGVDPKETVESIRNTINVGTIFRGLDTRVFTKQKQSRQ